MYILCNYCTSCVSFQRAYTKAQRTHCGHRAHDRQRVVHIKWVIILCIIRRLITRVKKVIAELQDPETGTFAGDEWGERDTRFLYGALNALSLMGLLELVNVDKAVEHIQSCANFDGGYGTSPGAESHSGQVFTCVAALAIAGKLNLVDQDKLGAWLSERQLKNGGLNGRPEKKEDVCYNPDLGGLSDRPGDMVDVFHTVFGIAGLSLLRYPGLAEVDPVYKGHLSNYYKVKVRSSNEDESRILIDSYDRWYAEWRVETLMSERMNQKDKRRTRARPAARATSTPKIEAPIPRSTRPRAGLGQFLDPRLVEQQMIKVETSFAQTPPLPPPPPHSGPVLRRRAFAPHMQCWPTGSRASSLSYTNADYETSSEYSDPSDRRSYRNTIEDSCAIEDDPVDAPSESPAPVSECTRLKGVYWPGMDLFDSATPEMRRKRNQKKDISVVEQLELNSQEVEPTELIFTPQGSFKKQRRISGSVYDDEESSPIKAESPRSFSSRPALAEMDVNTGRRSRQLPHPPPLPYPARKQYEEDNVRSDYNGYGYGDRDRGPKRRRAFDVFQEDDISFAQPVAFNYLTAGFHHTPSPSPAPAFPPYKAFDDPFQHDNKENVMPAYHQPAYEFHQHQPAGFHHYPPAFAYGLGHDQHVYQYQYHNPLYMSNAYQQHNNEDADDQRTLTAPPSPSTG
ncbi:hypothetical protein K504DRAFT_481512 [Pleomassaria siparia CBS 279.74]|uniref:protein geranylgeranyltransferase type II n=1 Tax=Pleomassaria siparia CBS 279.74 TaxID=1314801 RepID=A0A6G1KD14_9PLEO|nr:hypothetical protein K504DRAFT_481512 [Pleomassaria siparia CBS 279.74]